MSALVRCRRSLHDVVRRMIITFVAHAHSMDMGYQLHTRAVERSPPDERHWQELCMRELLLRVPGPRTKRRGQRREQEGGNPLHLQHIWATFATPSHRLRFARPGGGPPTTRAASVCASTPGPRFAWPGVRPPSPDGHTTKRGWSATQHTLHTVDGTLRVLLGLAGTIQAQHAPHHPILRSPETQVLLELLTRRMLVVWLHHSHHAVHPHPPGAGG